MKAKAAIIAGVGLVFAAGTTAEVVKYETPQADRAWREVERAEKKDSLPPFGFMFKMLSGKGGPQDVRKLMGDVAIPDEIKTAEKARDFYLRYPNHSNSLAARIFEYKNLAQAYRYLGDLNEMEAELKRKGHLTDPQKYSFANVLPRLLSLEQGFMTDTNLSQADRFVFRREQVNRLVSGSAAVLAGAAQELQREFPEKGDGYAYLRQAMERSSEDQARALAKDIIDSSAPEERKSAFKGFLNRLDSKGKFTSIHFTALDGREVDTAKLKGKVVLVAFWATWCGPCVAETPALTSAYDRFHARGLEIIGISLDEEEDKGRLAKYLKAKKIPWPQYFDGKGRDNQIALQFGIDGLPVLFLLDKQGILRETDVRSGLEQKINDLLAEP